MREILEAKESAREELKQEEESEKANSVHETNRDVFIHDKKTSY